MKYVKQGRARRGEGGLPKERIRGAPEYLVAVRLHAREGHCDVRHRGHAQLSLAFSIGLTSSFGLLQAIIANTRGCELSYFHFFFFFASSPPWPGTSHAVARAVPPSRPRVLIASSLDHSSGLGVLVSLGHGCSRPLGERRRLAEPQSYRRLPRLLPLC